jgi:hypothetical protein
MDSAILNSTVCQPLRPANSFRAPFRLVGAAQVLPAHFPRANKRLKLFGGDLKSMIKG